jgi:membrane protein DedA with SNARE-associated domain
MSFFLGIFLEGELVFISAVIAAHQGLMELWLVVLLAILSTVTSDMVYFNLGRKKATKWIRTSKWKNKFEIIQSKFDKHQMQFLLSYRFLYGLRIATPLVLGTSKIPFKKFVAYSIISTLIWAGIITFLGIGFGELILTFLKDIEKAEYYVIGGLLLLALILLLIRWHKGRLQKYKSSYIT